MGTERLQVIVVIVDERAALGEAVCDRVVQAIETEAHGHDVPLVPHLFAAEENADLGRPVQRRCLDVKADLFQQRLQNEAQRCQSGEVGRAEHDYLFAVVTGLSQKLLGQVHVPLVI